MNKKVNLLCCVASAVLGTMVQTQVYAQGKIVGIISVDWEGLDENTHKSYELKQENVNIQRMIKFRNDHPNIGLLQFLNAAYYTKEGADHSAITHLIQSVLRDNDEHGLHVHGWKSLVEASGVTFRTGPQMHTNDPVDLEKCTPPKDCGLAVNISAYSKEEIKSIIEFSKNTLVTQGFSEPTSFRAGGWLLGSQIVSALSETGFTVDSSAVPPELMDETSRERYANLFEWLQHKWSNIDTVSQPYIISQEGESRITEIPDNAILADYISASGMFNIFKQNARHFNQHPERNVYFSIGFHQESANVYLDRVDEAIELIEQYAKDHNIPFEWARLPVSNYFSE